MIDVGYSAGGKQRVRGTTGLLARDMSMAGLDDAIAGFAAVETAAECGVVLAATSAGVALDCVV